ncbi:MAG: phosphatase PAP2 family protein [Acidocella sp.]|nr:phosphatase PAP2 family protein [Acidocella sp.]
MPAIAPAPFFGGLFPDHLPDASLVPNGFVDVPDGAPIFDPRNTMPSLHATWGILAFLALRYSPIWHRFLGILCLLAILIVTLGSGQHYTVDWIAALPLVLLSRGICALTLSFASIARSNAVGFGVLLILFWVLAIHQAAFIVSHPVLIWLLAVSSVILPIWFEIQLTVSEMDQNSGNECLLGVKSI